MVAYILRTKNPAGRFNEKPSTGLTEQLGNITLKLRLKTELTKTGCRSINFEILEEQHADDILTFSFLTKKL